MPHARLTDATIRALKPPASGQVDYWDETPGFKGFGVRVSKGGSRTFILLHGPRRSRTTLGRYPILSLAKAREKAGIILAERTLGIEPEPPSITFGDGLTLYFSAHCDTMNRERTAYETKRLLNRHFKPKFERTLLSEIKTARVAELLDAIDGKSERRHAFVALRAFFRFVVRRGLLPTSPCDRLPIPGGKPENRERVLSNAELAAIWRAAGDMGYPFGTIVQLLILTGQRRSQIAGLRREWIKEDRIEFPAAVMKAKRPHTLPLGTLAEEILTAIPVEQGFLFPARRRGEHQPGERAFNGWSKDKAILQRRIDPALPQWGLHDLRRTVSTRWAELGIPPHVNDMLLAHTMQGVSAVHRIYNLATYFEPMHAALQQWELRMKALQQAAPAPQSITASVNEKQVRRDRARRPLPLRQNEPPKVLPLHRKSRSVLVPA